MSTETTTAISLSEAEAQWMGAIFTNMKEAISVKEAEYNSLLADSPLQKVMQDVIIKQRAMVDAILEKLQPQPQHITETADFKGFM